MAGGYAISPELVQEAMEARIRKEKRPFAACEAVAQVAAESSKPVLSEPVSEDLELRRRLEDFTERQGKEAVRQEPPDSCL